jgi:hypothetical protein
MGIERALGVIAQCDGDTSQAWVRRARQAEQIPMASSITDLDATSVQEDRRTFFAHYACFAASRYLQIAILRS